VRCYSPLVRIEQFEMERLQSLHWHLVKYDLSESGVQPLSILELAELADADPESFLATKLGYPLSEGSHETRDRIAAWYQGATTDHVTVVNGGSEANFLTLWTLLEPGDRLAFMVPNYMEGWGLGRHFGDATDVFRLRLQDERWALDLDDLERAVSPATKVVMVCNPDNPTGHVLTEPEMDAVIAAADRVGAWLVADEIYRGAELTTHEASPTFWGRYHKTVITSGLSKAFAMPGLRVGWIVAPPELIRDVWTRHDYTTLTPGMLSDVLAGVAMEPPTRDRILARTRRIVRGRYPPLDGWFRTHADTFRWVAPVAGAIAFVEYDLPVPSGELIERIRTEQSVLLVPSSMLGLGQDSRGIRFGFGFDIQHTLDALELVDLTLTDLG
jgi:aspartate/methionine/tyrosine aminotransferase